MMNGPRGRGVNRPLDRTHKQALRWEYSDSPETFFDPTVEEVRENPPPMLCPHCGAKQNNFEIVGQDPIPLEVRIVRADVRLRENKSCMTKNERHALALELLK